MQRTVLYIARAVFVLSQGHYLMIDLIHHLISHVGANIFTTPEARENLFNHAGVTIVKDSSANKVGLERRRERVDGIGWDGSMVERLCGAPSDTSHDWRLTPSV